MKRHRMFTTIAVLVLIAAVALAQGGPRAGQPNPGARPAPPAGPPVTISGSVISFTAGLGEGTPTLVIQEPSKQTTLVLGPFWFLQDAGFSASAGDIVEANVLACASCASGYAVVSVRNVTNGSSVTLRNAAGLPLWIGNRGAQGNAPNGRGPSFGPGRPGNGEPLGEGPEMTRAATFSGTVVSFTGGPGIGRPTLVLATANGDKTFAVGPYRVIVASGLELTPGEAVSIVAAPVVLEDGEEWVVITLTDVATGAVVIFRDRVTGLPSGGMGRGCKH